MNSVERYRNRRVLRMSKRFDEEIWRTTSNGKHYALETETGEIKKGNIGQAGKPRNIRSRESLIKSMSGNDSYVFTDKYKELAKKCKDSYREMNTLKEKRMKLGDQLKKEVEVDPELGRQYSEFLGLYTDKGKKIKEEYDKVSKGAKAAEDAWHNANKDIDKIVQRERKGQLQKWNESEHPIEKAKSYDYAGFDMRSDVPYIRDELESGKAYMSEMSPKEYLERCAYQVFEKSSFESSLIPVDFQLVQKYAKKMRDGEKFPVPYLNLRDRGQEGRHRAVAAYLNGYDKIPVVVIPSRFRKDEEIWRTTDRGKHYALETETGEITKGNIGQNAPKTRSPKVRTGRLTPDDKYEIGRKITDRRSTMEMMKAYGDPDKPIDKKLKTKLKRTFNSQMRSLPDGTRIKIEDGGPYGVSETEYIFEKNGDTFSGLRHNGGNDGRQKWYKDISLGELFDIYCGTRESNPSLSFKNKGISDEALSKAKDEAKKMGLNTKTVDGDMYIEFPTDKLWKPTAWNKKFWAKVVDDPVGGFRGEYGLFDIHSADPGSQGNDLFGFEIALSKMRKK